MPNVCIEFTGYLRDDGYGRHTVDGKQWLAHRYAWTQARGPIPDSLDVLHTCDNRSCIRVTPLRLDGTPDPDDHLWLGTQADNNADMVAKGRQRSLSGDHHPARMHPEYLARGAANGKAKLVEADIPVIRGRLASGEYLRDIAADYEVHLATIWKVAHGKIWTHV